MDLSLVRDRLRFWFLEKRQESDPKLGPLPLAARGVPVNGRVEVAQAWVLGTTWHEWLLEQGQPPEVIQQCVTAGWVARFTSRECCVGGRTAAWYLISKTVMDGEGDVELIKPRWDRGRRQLWYGKKLARQVAVNATNVIKVLDRFEKLDWPSRIDDPLDNMRSDLGQTVRSEITALNSCGLSATERRKVSPGDHPLHEEPPRKNNLELS